MQNGNIALTGAVKLCPTGLYGHTKESKLRSLHTEGPLLDTL